MLNWMETLPPTWFTEEGWKTERIERKREFREGGHLPVFNSISWQLELDPHSIDLIRASVSTV